MQKCSTIFRSTVGRGVCPFERRRKISKPTPGRAIERTSSRWIASGVTAYGPHSSQSTEYPGSEDAKRVSSSPTEAGKPQRKHAREAPSGVVTIVGRSLRLAQGMLRFHHEEEPRRLRPAPARPRLRPRAIAPRPRGRIGREDALS